MNVAVKISDVSKRYGDILALDRVSLDIGEGELFGIIGPDGAGKSTLTGFSPHSRHLTAETRLSAASTPSGTTGGFAHESAICPNDSRFTPT